MGRPAIQSFSPTPNVDVYECHPDSECQYRHWRLWDKRRKFNIAMSAKTKEDALVEGLEYWATRCEKFEAELAELRSKVERFVNDVTPPQED